MTMIPEALRRLFPARLVAPVPDEGLRKAESPGMAAKDRRADRVPPDSEQKGSRVGALLTYESLGEPVWSPRDYASFAREGFMQNAILYRSVRMISEAAASIPLILYEGNREIENHPLLDLMRKPSYDHTGQDFLESWFGFLLVAGNAYVEAVEIGGAIRELHILRPDRMKVIPGPDGWPEGYEYSAGGQKVRFEGEVLPGVRPILHTRLFHPVNDHYGMSPIEAAAVAIDIHNEASKWNKALLDNSARPSGALVYGAANGGLTGEQFERLKSELETTYQSAKNAGRPLLLEGGLDWKPLSLSPKDMDFIEAKNSAAREIALALGVPPMLLGIPGDNTYSNYAEAQRAFWRNTVLPLVNRMTRAFGNWLGPAFESAPGGRLSARESPGANKMELRADLDQVEALNPEREALWARLEGASFLTDDEKRIAAGYDGLGVEVSAKRRSPFDVTAKYSPDQPRVTAGNPDGGQWTDGGGGGAISDGLFGGEGRDVLEGGSGLPIDLLEEEAVGAHTYSEHVGKTEDYLKARITGSRASVPYIIGIGRKRAGSFLSIEAANKLVNSTLSLPDNAAMIEVFKDAEFPFWLPELRVFKTFSSKTGYEAFAEDDRKVPRIRSTFGVTVRLIRTNRVARGYYVESAWPMNED